MACFRDLCYLCYLCSFCCLCSSCYCALWAICAVCAIQMSATIIIQLRNICGILQFSSGWGCNITQIGTQLFLSLAFPNYCRLHFNDSILYILNKWQHERQKLLEQPQNCKLLRLASTIFHSMYSQRQSITAMFWRRLTNSFTETCFGELNTARKLKIYTTLRNALPYTTLYLKRFVTDRLCLYI
jgi:hypothetical protein